MACYYQTVIFRRHKTIWSWIQTKSTKKVRMGASFWLAFLASVVACANGQKLSKAQTYHPEPYADMVPDKTAIDKDGSYITPFQMLGNLRPTMGKSNVDHLFVSGDGPHRQLPNMLPVRPVVMSGAGSEPVFSEGVQRDQPKNVNFGSIVQPHQPTGYHHQTNSYSQMINLGETSNPIGQQMIVLQQESNRYVHEPQMISLGQIKGSTFINQHNSKRNIIGYRTVLEKRRVPVVTLRKRPIVRMKKVVTKVPVVKMVSRVVELPTYRKY